MPQDVLLSICVPTCKREYILREMLNSIYDQKVDLSLFEVCITDNSDTDETENLIKQEFSHIKNLKYKRVTCKGFLNSKEALKFGSGKLLKLHNDYSIFKPDALNRMINVINNLEDKKPVIFFSMGELKNKNQELIYNSFDEFMYNIHYFSTWSTSFSIWKNDFDKILEENITLNYMYPHTTLLYQLVEKDSYIVDDYEYVENLRPKKKGGYNLIDNFVRIYLTMVIDDLLNKQYISHKTFNKIQRNIIKFCAYWYVAVKHDQEHYTFIFDNYSEIITERCGNIALINFKRYQFFYEIKNFIKKIFVE